MDKPYRSLADLLNNPPSLGALSRSGFGLGTPPPLGARPTQPRGLIAGALRQPGIAAPHVQNSPLARYTSAVKANKQTHDRLLGVLMSSLSKLGSGFDLLTADLQGWSKPERIYWVTSGKGHVPDATAWHGHTKYIFEV